ncbi:MAG: repair protein SbcC/Rad50 [Actinomycetota bacterium]|nr:repair protein SbcC/Rad50 [Actinomycetota bacterium]
MRPTRLELTGFTSFREHTVIDLDGAEYFALVGPTGSGKSTIIDAICFALYGSVPRYEDRRLVAPVISSGELEAKVRLDFVVNGDPYSAARVVRRSPKGGASTKEARLEKNGEVIAGNADELSREVAKLLGLSFEHFTRCVVLPQGEFARFLHDDPKDRQDLLVELLHLGIYDQMRQAANNAAAEAKYEIQILEERLNKDLSFATDERLNDARRNSSRLKELRSEIAKADPQLSSLAKDIQRAEEEVDELRTWMDRIGKLEIPPGIADLGKELVRRRKKVSEVDKVLAGATASVEAAVKLVKGLPESGPLKAALKAHDRQGALQAKVATEKTALKKTSTAATAAAKALATAETNVEAAEIALNDARDANLAAHLAAGLGKGDECPVCLQPVGKVPHHAGRKGVEQAEKALDAARGAMKKAVDAGAGATSKLAGAEATVESLEEQLAHLKDELKDHSNRTKVETTLAKVESAHEALEKKRDAERDARDELAEARADLDEASVRESDLRTAFDKTRDGLVPLEPPPARRDDLADDWKQLLEWAKERKTGIVKEAAAADKAVNALRTKLDKLNESLRRSCAECGVEVGPGSMLEAVVAAHTQASEEVLRIEKAIADAAEMTTRLKACKLEQQTNHQLAQHLSAKAGMFENWIVNSALERLVEGATEILSELSEEQYALSIDDKGSFQVVDRHNANEIRSARTLSGGETFLASLALALALADQLADLSAKGAAHLDAIFLDEGFGTLDGETLRTVADTVEKLASGGRMVGVVTHVRELADSVPLQFRVSKESGSSRVERVAV